MKKILLVTFCIVTFVPFVLSSDSNLTESNINQTILLCEEGENSWGKFKAGKNTIEEVVKGKAKIPKKKKWKKLIKNNSGFSFYHFDLALFDVIQLISNSSLQDKVFFFETPLNGNASHEFVESLKGDNTVTEDFYEQVSAEDKWTEWDVNLEFYRLEETYAACKSSYIQSKLFQEKLEKAPWYMRSYPDKKDSWKSLNRETLILRSARGCMNVTGVGNSVYRNSMQKCYISDYEQIKKLNDALIKIENSVQPVVDEYEKESKEKLDKIKSANKI